MIVILLADGFEEIEALTPLDILRRANLKAYTVGITDKTVVGAHGIRVVSDLSADEVPPDEISLAIFPGGMPGSLGLDASPFTDTVIEAVRNNGARLAAICAAPLVLGRRGLLKGRRATCYPGFEKELVGATVTDEAVVTDGEITTSRGMGTALDFALELTRLMAGGECADEIAKAIMYKSDKDELGELLSALKDSDLLLDREEEKSEEGYTVEEYTEIEYTYPDTALLKDYTVADVDEDECESYKRELEKILDYVGVKAALSAPVAGPRLYCFELTPSKALSAKKIHELELEITLMLGACGTRITLPLGNSRTYRIEIPRKNAGVLPLRSLIETDEFKSSTSSTSVALGSKCDGAPIITDIAKLPHLLVAGAAGMGKSVCISNIISSLLYHATPNEVRLILIDPKQVEFTPYKDIPHLLVPIVTEAKRAAATLKYAVSVMESRYELLASKKIRSLDAYNKAVAEDSEIGKPLPKIVIIIDELADLMLQCRKSVETSLLQLTQKARAAGIYVIAGTQRPSVDVITGVIKANMPSRIAFKLASSADSRTIIDLSGAESLLPRGDMLYSFVGAHPERAQCAFISDSEICELTAAIKNGRCYYSERATAEIDKLEGELHSKGKPADADVSSDEKNGEGTSLMNDRLFKDAVDLALSAGKISTSLIQRKLSIGYSKAAKFIDIMTDIGIISEPNGQKPREVLVSRDEWEEMLARMIDLKE